MSLPRRATLLVSLLLVCVSALSACSSSDTEGDSGSSARFPDVVKVEVTADADGTYSFDVTISSPYDSPDRYADGWRVTSPDGESYGEITLGHDHASEQPFTRTQTGVEIPADVESVKVEGHDTENGYGGKTATVELPPS